MTERTDLTTFWELSPRIVEMSSATPAPRELTLQDLHDTLNSNTAQASAADDSLDSMDDEPLIDSAGKEDLGGGQLVGITSTLQNAQVAFAAKTAPEQTGTATSADANGTSLTDASATFITNGVERGAMIMNFTDQSLCEVLRVNSETQLDHRPLVEGISNDWSIGDAYKLWNIEQVNITGGNLVAVDDMDAELDPVFPTAFTQIVRTASASATLQEQEDIQQTAFAGVVLIDSLNGITGTTFPRGTGRLPVNNVPDAVAIAAERGIDTIKIIGNYTFDTGDDLSGYIVTGQNTILSSFVLNPGASLLNTQFENASVTGTLDGNSILFKCRISTLNFFNGEVRECILEAGTITLGGGGTALFWDCIAESVETAFPTIDFGGSGQSLRMAKFAGNMQFSNKTGTENAIIDANNGTFIINNSVTAGSFTFRGIGSLEDNSVGTTVDSRRLVNGIDIDLMRKVIAGARVVISGTDPQVIDVYEDDGTTIAHTFNVTADLRTRTKV